MGNVVITEATGGAWSLAKNDSPYNSARVARFHDLAFLIEGGPGGAQQYRASRPGVLSIAPSVGSGYPPNPLFCTASGTGMSVTVYSGGAVIERGSFSGPDWASFTPSYTGPYTCHLRQDSTLTVNNASTTSTRIDRIDAQLLDGPGYGDNAGTTQLAIVYTAGVAGSGVAPNAPINSIPLARITIPANTSTLTSAMFTDMRRSAGLRGAVRLLLPGDSLADSGTCHGEWRDTSGISSSGVHTIDRWDSQTSTWRTIQSVEPLVANMFQTSTQSVPASTWTKAVLQSTRFDPAGICSTSNSRITPGLPGYYRATYASAWTAGNGAAGADFVSLYRNGSVEPGSTRNSPWYVSGTVPPNGIGANGSCEVVVTNATDYFELWLYQTNPGSVSTYQDTYNKCSLALEFVRGL